MLLMLGGYDLRSGPHGKGRKGPLQRQETEMKVAVYIRTVGSHHFNYCFEHKNGAGRGCEGLSSQQWPENDCGKPLGPLK